MKEIEERNWKSSEKAMAQLTKTIAEYSGMGRPTVRFVHSGCGKPRSCHIGESTSCEIHFNLDVLGRNFALDYRLVQVLSLIIHELAYVCSENLSDAYQKEIERMGAIVAIVALRHPEMFKLPEY